MIARWASSPNELPEIGGAYALMIELGSTARLPRKFDGALLKPGRYLYAGSARGPGGIRARCARHLKAHKTRRWHIDWLTTQALTVQALALPHTVECEIIRILSELGENTFPLRHFGSSDCRVCPAHLVETTLGEPRLRAILGAA